MKVIIVPPNKPAYIAEVENELKALQAIVGGYIEVVPLLPGAVVVCNKEGKLKGLEPNRTFGGDVLCGTFFICSTDGEEFTGLSYEQAEDFLAILNSNKRRKKL